MTPLNDLLALLPDNTSGQISPADLRTIVTDLWNTAHLRGQTYAYRWNTPADAAGEVGLNNGWAANSTVLTIGETSEDGTGFNFGFVDSAAPDAKIEISDASGRKLVADITGPSADLGVYRELPISVTEISGTAPANNAVVTVSTLVLVQ